MQCVADAREWIAVRYAAGVTFVYRDPQRREIRLVLPFFALKCPKRGADHFAGVLVASAFHSRKNEAVQLFGQIYISRGHGGTCSEAYLVSR